mmetsp:Transcript_98035/g.245591  ORF Transcript_98035/g.245591 Transcript_98035/m.245591 type:complete len:403 (+) Transcript_98035:76-1284(+)
MPADIVSDFEPKLSHISAMQDEELSSAVEESPLISDVSEPFELPEQTPRTWTRRSQAVLALPVALLVVFLMGALAFARNASTQSDSAAAVGTAVMTPRQLFDSDRFADVAADNVMVISQGRVPPEHRRQIRDRFREGFRNISTQLWERYPESGAQLDQVTLGETEQDAFVTMMRSVSDPRVRRLGRDVGLYMHQSLSVSSNSADAKRRIIDSLEPDFAQIRQLRDEVIPEAVRGSPDEADGGSLTLNPQGVSFMRTFDRWNVEVDMATPEIGAERRPVLPARRLSSSSSSADKASMTDQLVSLMKMEAQAEKFFKQVQEYAASKFNVHVPDLNEALRGVDTTDAVKCAMEAAMTANIQSLMQCAMEFWSIAMDIMQNVASSIGPVTTSTEQVKFDSFEDMMD